VETRSAKPDGNMSGVRGKGDETDEGGVRVRGRTEKNDDGGKQS